MKRKEIGCLLVLCIIVFPINMIEVQSDDIPQIFSISLLTPNASHTIYHLAMLMENQFPKIGIGVDFHSTTSWANIAPRTWDYPLIDFDYIPTYDEGGYDLLFLGRTMDLDWDPTGLFDTSWSPGLGITNFYQYVNPVYENLLDNYLSDLNPENHTYFGKQMQAILYEDLPSIALIYNRLLYGFKEGLEGIDSLLMSIGKERYEYWNDASDNIIKFAIPTNLKENNTFIQEENYDKLWMQGIYGSLFQREQITRLWEPQIAADIFFSEDNMNITVILDSEAKFSDGSPVLAEDVEYSYELHLTPAVGSTSYSKLSKWLASNDSVSSVGSDIVTFNLTQTNAFVHNLLTYGIIDKSDVQPAISTYGYSIFDEEPLTGNVSDVLVKSCGPFKLDSINYTESTVKLIPNSYYGELANYTSPLLDELNFMFVSGKDTAVANLLSGYVDIVDAKYFPKIADFFPSGVEGILVKAPTYFEIAVNMRHPVFGTGELTPLGTPESAKYVRKAISHAIPRTIIVSEIMEGLAKQATTPCPDSSPVYDDSLKHYVYDLDLARWYMEHNWDLPDPTTTTGDPTTTVGDTWMLSLTLLSLVGLTVIQSIKRKT